MISESSADKATLPFTIRAHHLMTFSQLVYDRENINLAALSPEALASSQNYHFKRLRSLLDREGSRHLGEYAIDMIGLTEDDRQINLNKSTQVFKNFQQLTDTDRVDITLGPDKLCEACVIGEHCRKLRPDDSSTLTAVQVDNLVLDVFLYRVRNVLPLGNTVRIAYENISFSDGGTYYARRAQTFAGTVKQFLANTHPMFFDRDVNNPSPGIVIPNSGEV